MSYFGRACEERERAEARALPRSKPRDDVELATEAASRESDDDAPAAAWWLAALASLVIFGTYVGLGIGLIPTEFLFNFDEYHQAGAVLASVGIRIARAPAFTLLAWLAPLPVAMLLPLDVLTDVFRALSIVIGIVMVGSLISSAERARTYAMLQELPSLGYMWHDTVLILACALYAQPERPSLIFLGPGAVVCGGAPVTRRPAIGFVAAGLIGLLVVLPTAYRFVDTDTGSMFIAGYTTDSVFGTMLAYSVVLAFTRTYHLVARSGYRVLRASKTCSKRGLTCVWLLFGTAFTELWVSSAYAFYLAYTSCETLAPETPPRFVQDLRRKAPPFLPSIFGSPRL